MTLTPARELSTPEAIARSPGGWLARHWPTLLVATLAVALPVLIGVLKVNALIAWRYTSDLFHADMAMQETLRGNFTIDFVFGRQFGDHACLILLLLLPVKYLLGQWMVFLLVLLPAVTMGVCGVILFACARAMIGARAAAVATVIYFLSVGVLRATFETTFGFHVDTMSGYVAVAMAALLLRADHARSEGGRDVRRRGLPALAAVAFFCLLKEEMALLAVGFFLVLLILPHRGRPRSRLHWAGLAISLALLVIELVIIQICQTRYNRSSSALFAWLVNHLREHGVIGFLFASGNVFYWQVVVAHLAILGGSIAIARRLNPYAAALAAMGCCKLAFSWAAPDFDLWTWHNYPGLLMLTGAVVMQVIEMHSTAQPADRPSAAARTPRLVSATIGALIVLAVGWFFIQEAPFYVAETRANRPAREAADLRRDAMREMMRRINRDNAKAKVVAIPRYTAYEWTNGYRYTLFPGGISDEIKGLAEYLILAKTKAAARGIETTVFKLEHVNAHWRLYRRKAYLPGEKGTRLEFIAKFGHKVLGLPPPLRLTGEPPDPATTQATTQPTTQPTLKPSTQPTTADGVGAVD